MNTLSNRFYHITKLIGLELFNLKFVNLKKNYEDSVFKKWEDIIKNFAKVC